MHPKRQLVGKLQKSLLPLSPARWLTCRNCEMRCPLVREFPQVRYAMLPIRQLLRKSVRPADAWTLCGIPWCPQYLYPTVILNVSIVCLFNHYDGSVCWTNCHHQLMFRMSFEITTFTLIQ